MPEQENMGAELNTQLENWLSKAAVSMKPAKAIIAPHAGYYFCGACGAHAYRQVDPNTVKKVFILGPSHHVRMSNCALSGTDTYETPLYSLTIDKSRAVLDVKRSGVSGSNYTHCLATGGPLEFSNPFPPDLAQDNSFIAMSWFLDSLVDGTWVEGEQLLDYSADTLTIRPTGVAQYEFWGVKIADVSVANSGRYRALAVTTEDELEYVVTVVVAEQPQLGSEKLDVTRKETPDKIVLSCGEIVSLGTPPAIVTWKASNGSVLPSTFRDGYFILTLTPEEDDGEFSCTLDPSSPAAHCIPEEELPRWEGSIVLASKTSSASMGGLIGGIVAALVVVVIVVIIIVFIIRRKKNGNSYNAKEEEARVTRGDNSIPLMDKNESHGPIYKDPSNDSKAPIYKDPANNSHDPNYKGSLASPYMVSGIKLPYAPGSGELDPATKKLRAPVATHEYETDRTNGKEAPKSETGNSRKDSDPPRAKPRKVFLTPSMEALDQAGKEGVSGSMV